jgi:hypothetical protein
LLINLKMYLLKPSISISSSSSTVDNITFKSKLMKTFEWAAIKQISRWNVKDRLK